MLRATTLQPAMAAVLLFFLSACGTARAQGVLDCDQDGNLFAPNKYCGRVAKHLNDMFGKGEVVSCFDWSPWYDMDVAQLQTVDNQCEEFVRILEDDYTMPGFACLEAQGGLQFFGGPSSSECLEAALELGRLIGDALEDDLYKRFYTITGPIVGAAFVLAGSYSLTSFDAATASGAFVFAFFAALRTYDVASDWGLWDISMVAEHQNTTLRKAALAFSIIGSLLFLVDLVKIHSRGRVWFGESSDSGEVKEAGKLMLAICFLEDIPQLIITGIFLSDTADRPDGMDTFGIFCAALSGMSLLANLTMGCSKLRGDSFEG